MIEFESPKLKSSFISAHSSGQECRNDLQRKSSKFSKKMQSSLIEDNNNYEDTRCSSILNRESEHLIINMNLICNEEKFSIQIKINNFTKINDLIRISISRFNSYFCEKHINLQIIANDFKPFVLKPSNKNGFPKIDYPKLDPSCFVCDTKIRNLSLIVPPTAVFIIKQLNNKSFSEGYCRQCKIF